jgi:hypothetical protein
MVEWLNSKISLENHKFQRRNYFFMFVEVSSIQLLESSSLNLLFIYWTVKKS